MPTSMHGSDDRMRALRDEIRKDKTAAQKAHRLHKACEAAYKVIDTDKKLGRKNMKNLFVDGDLDLD